MFNISKYSNSPTDDKCFDCLCKAIVHPQSHNNLLNKIEQDIYAYISNIENKILLDLGCGFGSQFVWMLKRKGHYPKQIINFDANPKVFKKKNLNKYYNRKEDINIIGDAHDLCFQSNSIDLVHQYLMLEDSNFEDKPLIYKEISRILKSDGFYICSKKIPEEYEYGFKEIKHSSILWYHLYKKY